MYTCVSQVMEQDYTATREGTEFCILTLCINKMFKKKQIMQNVLLWENFKYLFHPKMYLTFQRFVFQNHKSQPQMYLN